MAELAQVGQFQFAQQYFCERYILSDHQDNIFSDGKMRTQKGWGFFGGRVFSQSEIWELLEETVPSEIVADISISSVSGALIGKIRTDIQYSIVQSLQFVLDEHGCATFLLKLNKLPDFPILPFSIIAVKIGDTDYNWYSGEISYQDEQGTQQEVFEFRGIGIRERLEKLRADTTYIVGLDVGEVIDDLIQTWVQPYSPIKYNASKIDTTTGVILANDIELSKQPLAKVFETLSGMAGYEWGVDGDQDFFFLEKDEDIQKTFFIGYDIQSFEPKTNLSGVKNAIIVQRQEGAAGGGAGWSVAGIYNDETSIKKYGKKELTYQIPGFFENEEADVVGNSILEGKSEPKLSGEMKNFRVIGANQYLDRGRYKFILPFDKFSEIYCDVDDEMEWTKYGAGNLAVSKENDIFVYGNGCIKLEYTDALNDRIEFSSLFKLGKIKRIRFFVRANKTGTFMSVGVGYGAWDQNVVKVNVPIKNIFYNFDWNINNLDVDVIDRIAFRIDEDVVGSTNIFLDKIEVEVEGFRYYNLEMKESKYYFETKRQAVDASFGELPPKMENYIANLFKTSEELRFTQEIR